MTDGESDEVDLRAATAGLRAEGIPVFALGVGTTGGGPVPADSSEAPEKFHRDHIGRIAMSRLEETDLRQAAKLTGGAYARADRADQRARLRAALTKVQSRVLTAQTTRERRLTAENLSASSQLALFPWSCAPNGSAATTAMRATRMAEGCDMGDCSRRGGFGGA